jgi:5-methylcytosine-specific restriction endonuclease McrBC regulatory subunit McrC
MPDVVTAMKTIYAAALERLLVRGILREYRMEEDDLVSVRGRIDVTDMALKRFGAFPPLRCRFQEYTVDREANRRLLAAALGLANAGDCRDQSSRTLSRLAARFEGVAICRYRPTDVTPLRRDRLLTHYDPALGVAETVLQNASLEPPPGSTGALRALSQTTGVPSSSVH